MPLKIDGPIGRAVTKLAGSSAFLKIAPSFVPAIDKILHKVSGGRFVMSSGMVPSLVLTCTGAKTGEKRTIPLACRPNEDGSYYVVGSNFGRPDHPAWTTNLLANPQATVSFRGKDIAVTASLLDDAEHAAVWPQLTKVWPNYDRYVEHAGGRQLRVFRLTPRP